MRVGDVAGNGPDRYCSPLHRLSFVSRNKGSKCVSMTWRDGPRAWQISLATSWGPRLSHQ